MISITNNYHDTAANVRAKIGDTLTVGQVRRVRKTLCGISTCACGGNLSERGKQTVEITPVDQIGSTILVRLDPLI